MPLDRESGSATVVVGEDQALVREGIVRMLESQGLEVLAVADNAPDVLRKARAYRPDVVVTDIQMPPGRSDDGLQVAISLRSEQPRLGVLVLSQFLEERYVLELVGDRPESVGYLLKEKVAVPEILGEAIRRVARGGTALDADVIAHLITRKRVSGPLDRLTERERTVLALMAQGQSNTGIARELTVTVAAIERHVTGIFAKLGLREAHSDQHRRVLAVLQYLGHTPPIAR